MNNVMQLLLLGLICAFLEEIAPKPIRRKSFNKGNEGQVAFQREVSETHITS